MIGFLAVIGAIFVLFAAAGVAFKGIAFHVYFGTSKGAKEWHEKYVKEGDQGSHFIVK